MRSYRCIESSSRRGLRRQFASSWSNRKGEFCCSQNCPRVYISRFPIDRFSPGEVGEQIVYPAVLALSLCFSHGFLPAAPFRERS